MDIAVEPSYEAYVRVGVHKYLEVHQAAHLRVDKNQDAFNDDYRPGLDVNRLRLSRVTGIIVDGLLDPFTGAQRFEVIHQQFGVECIGMVVVDFRCRRSSGMSPRLR